LNHLEYENTLLLLHSLHLEKKAIRSLGVAESFRKDQEISTLAGVVIRSDLVIDGFAIGRLKVSGSDATKSVLKLYKDLERNDVNAIIISGSVLSLYNVLDIDVISEQLELPVIALSFSKAASDLVANVRGRFSNKVASDKIALLEKLGKAEKIRLKTGYDVFVRVAGITQNVSTRLLDKFTLQGAIPEPIRVARLLAKTIAPLREK
jgi:endonuclease V-like protein UPF0215 family